MLLPTTPGFTMSGFEPVQFERLNPKVTSKVMGEIRHGRRGGRPDVRLLGGWFVFGSPDSGLLVSLLPALVHVRGVERLSTVVRLVGEEASERKPGRNLVLTRLVEVMLIEAMRLTPGEDSPPGLLRGLADARLAPAIREMHGKLARSWTVAQLARRPRSRGLRSSNASRAPSARRRWNTCSPGAWRSRRTCCAATTFGSTRWPNESATVGQHFQYCVPADVGQPPSRYAESVRASRVA